MEISRRKSASTCLAKLAKMQESCSMSDPDEESEDLDDDQDASFAESSSSETENSELSSLSDSGSPPSATLNILQTTKTATKATKATRCTPRRTAKSKLIKTTEIASPRLQRQPLLNELIRVPMQCNGFSGPTSMRTKSPLVTFLLQSRRKLWQTVNDKVMHHFKAALNSMDMVSISHPFSVYSNEHRSELEKCQRILFPINASWFTPCRRQDVPIFLSNPKYSPTYGVHIKHADDKSFKTLERFSFDPVHKLLYVGGTVRLLSWCPSNLTRAKLLATEEVEESSYLALVSYASPDTRVCYSDPKATTNGLIQIWNCGTLALTQQDSSLQPKPHVFIAHNWGHVVDMCWLPVPLRLVLRAPPDAISRATFIPVASVQRVLNHLMVACQDGQVRLFAVPRCRPDQTASGQKRGLPVFTLTENYTVKLSVCPGELPRWIGWPTRIHIRKEHPHRLLVGYSTGHIAYFDLSSLNPLVSSMSRSHLAPIRLFRLIKGPVRSLSLNPTNGRHFLAQGFDRQVRIWDLEDTAALTPDSAEIEWTNHVGLISAGTAGIFWLPGGDFICMSRDYSFAKRTMTGQRGTAFRAMGNLVERLDNYVYLVNVDAPTRSARQLIPLGIQTNSSVDYCEALNSLLLATDRGRLEAIMLSLDDRWGGEPHVKYVPRLRYPLCQWTIVDAALEDAEKKRNAFKLNNKKMTDIVAAPRLVAELASNDAVASEDPECPECQLDRSYCWHRLWREDRLYLYMDNIPAKPFSDFVKTPLLNISQARFCPNIQSTTWIAVGTSLGFVQFVCAERLYRKDMDLLLNRGVDPTLPSHLTDTAPARSETRVGRPRKRSSSSEGTIPAEGGCWNPEASGELDVSTISDNLQELHVCTTDDQQHDHDLSSCDTEPYRSEQDDAVAMPTKADGDNQLVVEDFN